MKKRLRLWLAWRLQRWSWSLTNPHDSWMLEWAESDETGTHRYGAVHHGPYKNALIVASERGGRIVGSSASEVRAD